MYNLFPEIGDLNARRSNHAMGQVARGTGIIDTGHGKIGGGTFEPPDNVKAISPEHTCTWMPPIPICAWSPTKSASSFKCGRRVIQSTHGNVSGRLALRKCRAT